MPLPIDEIALAAAEKLAGQYGESLIPYTHTALQQKQSQPTTRSYDDFGNIMTLATFLVSLVSLACTIYQTFPRKDGPPKQEVVVRKIILDERYPTGIPKEHGERVTKVVVEVLIKNDRAD